MQVSCDGEVVSDAVIFEYKTDPSKTNVAKNESQNDVISDGKDSDIDDDSLSLIWECGNVCNSYLCETDTCRKALRATLLQRMEEMESKFAEITDVVRQEKKVLLS